MNKPFFCPPSNLAFFLTQLRALGPCRSLDLPWGGFCLSTGLPFASDNWVLGVPTPGSIQAALQFFQEEDVPFIWPLFEASSQAAALLARGGLRERGHLLAMSRDTAEGMISPGLDCAFLSVRSPEDAIRWARTMWLGFDGDGEPPASYLNLAEAMRGTPALSLSIARLEGRDVGTFLLVSSGDEAGIYYFATLPEFRRRGVATAMMNEALRLIRGEKALVLQATPAGVPFYLRVSFVPLYEIPLFSASEDVF